MVPPTREANHQATAVWLEGESPPEELYRLKPFHLKYFHVSTSKLDLLLIRRSDLAVELNFHLTEYQTGRLGRLDEMNEPSRQVRKYHLATFDPSHLAPGGRGGRGDRVHQHGDGDCQAG